MKKQSKTAKKSLRIIFIVILILLALIVGNLINSFTGLNIGLSTFLSILVLFVFGLLLFKLVAVPFSLFKLFLDKLNES